MSLSSVSPLDPDHYCQDPPQLTPLPVQAASLNYRDLAIVKGFYPFALKTPIVPTSDGAGVVEAVGSGVTRFQKGDKVLTLFNQGHLAGSLDHITVQTGVGGTIDGALQQYGAFNEQGLVAMPSNLDFLQGSTLVCAGLTAWNGLYGLESRSLKPGDWVLTQGTGGVSMFAVQFAKAAGAKVIATTSSAAKGDKLKALGADHVINYKEVENWGEEAKKLTPGGRGVQHILEVGGPNTMVRTCLVLPFLARFSITNSGTFVDPIPQSRLHRRRHLHHRFPRRRQGRAAAYFPGLPGKSQHTSSPYSTERE
jgi:NADPH:quinone reductase-like Zn-dependent oxidoreductase